MRATRDAVLGGEASPVRSEPWRPGLRYVSWTPRGLDGVSRDAQRVLARLTAGLAASDVLLLHDNSPLSLEVLATLLEHLNARGLKSVSLPTACSLSS
jgi:hypothetical protein